MNNTLNIDPKQLHQIRKQQQELALRAAELRRELSSLNDLIDHQSQHLNFIEHCRDPSWLASEQKDIVRKIADHERAIASLREYSERIRERSTDDDYYYEIVNQLCNRQNEARGLSSRIGSTMAEIRALEPRSPSKRKSNYKPVHSDEEVWSGLSPELIQVLRGAGKTDKEIIQLARM